MPELSVIVASFNRRPILAETLARLEAQSKEADFEVIVVDNASDDGTDALVQSMIENSPLELRYIHNDFSGGLSRARNRAIALAQAPVCLLLNDDLWPDEGMVARHQAFHRAHEAPEEALMGRMVTAPETATPFMRWLDRSGIRGGYERIEDHDDVPPEFFLTGNLSIKTGIVQAAGGFDESYVVGWEDIEIGFRLQRRGLRLRYDPDVSGRHFHPLGLAEALTMQRHRGREQARHWDRLPGLPGPRPPTLRFRLMALVLTALSFIRPRPAAVRHATWHFLCYEANREGFWRPDAPDDAPLEIGDRLARLACRDPGAGMPDHPGTGLDALGTDPAPAGSLGCDPEAAR